MERLTDLVGVKTASERLGLSIATVYRLGRERKLSCYRVGRKVRFSLSDLDAYLSSLVEYISAERPAGLYRGNDATEI